MTTLDLSGSLEGLKILAVGDLARYKAAVTAGKQMGWGSYFPNLLSKNWPGRSAALLLEDEGAICSFLQSLQQFELINDGSDTGRAGLRQLKESFRPVQMHVEYRGTQPK